MQSRQDLIALLITEKDATAGFLFKETNRFVDMHLALANLEALRSIRYDLWLKACDIVTLKVDGEHFKTFTLMSSDASLMFSYEPYTHEAEPTKQCWKLVFVFESGAIRFRHVMTNIWFWGKEDRYLTTSSVAHEVELL